MGINGTIVLVFEREQRTLAKLPKYDERVGGETCESSQRKKNVPNNERT